MRTKTILPLVALIALVGCTTTQPGNDPVVVNAERDTQLAADTFTLVATTEQQTRALLVSIDYKTAIQIKHGVDFIRLNSPKWLASARAITKAYKENRTAQNKATLQTAMTTLSAGLAQAQQYLTQINQMSQQKATP
jgi:hypothetical protein